jgi:hypothetical protein
MKLLSLPQHHLTASACIESRTELNHYTEQRRANCGPRRTSSPRVNVQTSFQQFIFPRTQYRGSTAMVLNKHVKINILKGIQSLGPLFQLFTVFNYCYEKVEWGPGQIHLMRILTS